MTTQKSLDKKKELDYIVVKTNEEAESLILTGSPSQSLRGKWIIVAPNVLEFVSLEELLRLPKIKEYISSQRQQLLKEILELESMKEEDISSVPFHNYEQRTGRNQLRSQLRDEINKLFDK